MRIAVAGATGLTGEVLLSLLPQSAFADADLVLLASERSRGKPIRVAERRFAVQKLTEDSFAGVDMAFFALGDELSRKFVPLALAAGAHVVDKSNAFRMDPAVPLVVVGVNEERALGAELVANPNCTTIGLAHILSALKPFGLEQVVVSSYQALSGAGRPAVEAFWKRLRTVRARTTRSPLDVYDPVAAEVLNLNPAIGAAEGLHFGEELKLKRESAKILELTDTAIYATAVRVPTLVGHALSVHTRLRHHASTEDVHLALEDNPNIFLLPDDEIPESSLAIAHRDRVVVGRVRAYFDEGIVELFAVSDNLHLGAALNALRIAECMLRA